jgi:hypothetical protein
VQAAQRVLELDRHGNLLTALRWSAAGRLAAATVRIPDGRWVTIQPAADASAGSAPDRLWLGARPFVRSLSLSAFEPLPYGAVTFIPTLAEPARLPPGAGTAVLNLVATLAADQGRPLLAYAGPYPGEELFLALLESFRYETAGDDPLGAFRRGELAWRPAPHERLFTRDGTYVQLRERVEKVVREGRTYVRPDWQGVRRHAPRRVRDVDGAVVCSLWALDTVVEDHLVVGADGELIRRLDPAPASAEVGPLAPAVPEGLVAVVAGTSAAPLHAAIAAEGDRMRFAWGPVDRDLVAVRGDDVCFASVLRALVVARVQGAPTRADALGIGLAALTELAALVGDTLRARAQARLLTLPESAQAATLSTVPAGDGANARRIVRAVEALVEDSLRPPR